MPLVCKEEPRLVRNGVATRAEGTGERPQDAQQQLLGQHGEQSVWRPLISIGQHEEHAHAPVQVVQNLFLQPPK